LGGTDGRWADGFIAVDWGTTNRRAYLLGSHGRLLDEMEDVQGILSVPEGRFPDEVEEIRARLGDRPMLLGGMVGSNRGWVEAAYVPAPAGLPDLVAGLCWVEPGRVAIIPGVSWSQGDAADVMRGEETQFLGAVAAGAIGPDALVCHPGTHNKWAHIEGGRIGAFRTVMTGELFNLLRGKSILADLMAEPTHVPHAFEAGVRRGLESDELTAELFSIRARVLVGKAPREEAASFASGLLIGTDLRIGLRASQAPTVVVMGRPELTGLFATALRIAGREPLEVDGEEAFLAGVKAIAKELT